MSALLARLAKIEARMPSLVPAQAERPPVDFSELIREIQARTAWFETATPRQKIIRLQERIDELQAETEQPEVVSGLKIRLEGLRESAIENEVVALKKAELELLAELGHPGLCHPLSPYHREIIDFEMFDA